jgi:cysteine synthase
VGAAVSLPAPVVERHGELLVVRDDLVPGGTKARFLPALFEDVDELVYASPAEGGMQLALAYTARRLGKVATIFVAERRAYHARTAEAMVVGANVVGVRPGYLSTVQARARLYAQATEGARYLEFGGASPVAEALIAAAAREVLLELGDSPPQVWCAAGSGVLSRGLQRAFPDAQHFAVQVGREVHNAGRAAVLPADYAFEAHAATMPPFPSCPHYDAKAWEIAEAMAVPGALFWNVMGPSPTGHA